MRVFCFKRAIIHLWCTLLSFMFIFNNLIIPLNHILIIKALITLISLLISPLYYIIVAFYIICPLLCSLQTVYLRDCLSS